MAGKLKALDVERETKPGRYFDGDGLYLVVTSATAKNWLYRYWFNGKQRWHGLGSFKDVSLKSARASRDAARLKIKGDRSTPGVDIVGEKQAARQHIKAKEIAVAAPTFQQCAERYIDEHWSTWSEKHRVQWPSSLKRYAYPTIGGLTIPQIRPSHIYELLAPIWDDKRETANRVRGRIETIIAKNIDINDLDFRNPAELTKQLREKLPKRSKRTVRHHPALPYTDTAAFMVQLWGGGAKGLGGRTHRYTLNMAGLAVLEAQDEWTDLAKDVKNLHSSQHGGYVEGCERGEIRGPKMRNPRPKGVKRLHTNLRDTQRESVTAPNSSETAGRKRLRGEGVAGSVTSVDHTNLARCVGGGSISLGYDRLQKVSEDEINALALQLRREPSSSDSIRLQVAGLHDETWRMGPPPPN